MNAAELAKVLDAHRKWRRGEEGGTRADLTRADLTRAVLTDADLTRAVLTDAVLTDAVLTDAVLTRADLTRADLTRAVLTDAVLTDAVLTDAVLTRADLTGADLTGAVLTGAVLTDAVLTDAVLTRADLTGAVLTRAVLTDADLTGAVLTDADLTGAVLTGAVEAATTDAQRAQLRGATTPPEDREARRVARRAAAANYRARHPTVPVVPNLDAQILARVDAGTHALDMSSWHDEACSTTHCRAGHAIDLAGKDGYALEREMEARHPTRGAYFAGAAIYRASTGRQPDFFASTDRALEDLRRCPNAPATFTRGTPI